MGPRRLGAFIEKFLFSTVIDLFLIDHEHVNEYTVHTTYD